MNQATYIGSNNTLVGLRGKAWKDDYYDEPATIYWKMWCFQPECDDMYFLVPEESLSFEKEEHEAFV